MRTPEQRRRARHINAEVCSNMEMHIAGIEGHDACQSWGLDDGSCPPAPPPPRFTPRRTPVSSRACRTFLPRPGAASLAVSGRTHPWQAQGRRDSGSRRASRRRECPGVGPGGGLAGPGNCRCFESRPGSRLNPAAPGRWPSSAPWPAPPQTSFRILGAGLPAGTATRPSATSAIRPPSSVRAGAAPGCAACTAGGRCARLMMRDWALSWMGAPRRCAGLVGDRLPPPARAAIPQISAPWPRRKRATLRMAGRHFLHNSCSRCAASCQAWGGQWREGVELEGVELEGNGRREVDGGEWMGGKGGGARQGIARSMF